MLTENLPYLINPKFHFSLNQYMLTEKTIPVVFIKKLNIMIMAAGIGRAKAQYQTLTLPLPIHLFRVGPIICFLCISSLRL